MYGVKNSFYRFMREVIPPQIRMNLLNLVRINVENKADRRHNRQGTEFEKEAFLYKIRNDFTHKTYSTGAMRDIRNDDWNSRERIYKNNEVLWVSTHKSFDDKLKEVILIGISELVKKPVPGDTGL